MPETTDRPYTFSTGLNIDSNLEGFAGEIRNTPELIPVSERPSGTEIDISDEASAGVDLVPQDFEDPATVEEEQQRKLGRSVAENGGKALARSVDRVASVILAYIAHGEPSAYRSDKTEMADLQEAFVEFMMESGFVMSPGWNLAVALTSIYGFKAMSALHDRREYEKKQGEGEKKS